MHFIIPGEPVSKERPRFTKTGHSYTPARTREAEKNIAELFREETDNIKFEGYVELKIVLWLGTKRRKDADNMAKLIQDALNGLAFIDDSQVHELTISKKYTTPDRARAEVTIRELESVEIERAQDAKEIETIS